MVRYPTPAVRHHLNERFDLPDDSRYQDWPLEVSSPTRVEEFLDAYDREPWGDDERYALMELILFSYEERLMLAEQSGLLQDRVRETLVRDFELHRPTVEYWCRLDLPDAPAEEQCVLTPLAREVWAEAAPAS